MATKASFEDRTFSGTIDSVFNSKPRGENQLPSWKVNITTLDGKKETIWTLTDPSSATGVVTVEQSQVVIDGKPVFTENGEAVIKSVLGFNPNAMAEHKANVLAAACAKYGTMLQS